MAVKTFRKEGLVMAVHNKDARPISPIALFLSDGGERAYALVPVNKLLVSLWEALPVVEPDEVDLAFLARLEKDPQSYLRRVLV